MKIIKTVGKRANDGVDEGHPAKRPRLQIPLGTLKGLTIFWIPSNCFNEINVILLKQKNSYALAATCKLFLRYFVEDPVSKVSKDKKAKLLACAKPIQNGPLCGLPLEVFLIIFSKLSGKEKWALGQLSTEHHDRIINATVDQYKSSLTNKSEYFIKCNQAGLSKIGSKLHRFLTHFWNEGRGIRKHVESQAVLELEQLDSSLLQIDICLFKIFEAHVNRQKIGYADLKALKSDPPRSMTPLNWSALLPMTCLPHMMLNPFTIDGSLLKKLLQFSKSCDTVNLVYLLRQLFFTPNSFSIDVLRDFFSDLVAQNKFQLLADLLTSLGEEIRNNDLSSEGFPKCLTKLYQDRNQTLDIVKFLKNNKCEMASIAYNLLTESIVSYMLESLYRMLSEFSSEKMDLKTVEMLTKQCDEMSLRIENVHKNLSQSTLPLAKHLIISRLLPPLRRYLDCFYKSDEVNDVKAHWMIFQILSLIGKIEDKQTQTYELKFEIESASSCRKIEWEVVKNLREPLKSLWIENRKAKGIERIYESLYSSFIDKTASYMVENAIAVNDYSEEDSDSF